MTLLLQRPLGELLSLSVGIIARTVCATNTISRVGQKIMKP